MTRAPYKRSLPVLLLVLLTGCGHGRYTSAFKDEAIAALARVRAATDYDVALQQFQSGDLERALATVSESIRLNGAVAPGHLLHGRILFEMGKTQQALTALQRAAALAPGNPGIDYCLGIVLERMGRLEDALARYRSALELAGDRPHFRLAAAETLIELGRLDEAQSLLDSPESDLRLHSGFRQTLGHIALMRGDVAGALTFFGEAAILSPNDPVLLEDLARTQLAAGRYAAGEATLRRITAMPSARGRRDLRLMHASCLLEVDRHVEARRILMDLARAEGADGDVEAWILLIQVALLLDDQHLLRQVAGHLIATAPERHEGYLAMSMWQRQVGDVPGARATIERALARAGDDPAPRCFKVILQRQ